jgi:hypothetical protein
MVWVGLDLHKRYITACALDDDGAVVADLLPVIWVVPSNRREEQFALDADTAVVPRSAK